ncbi:hypothetical protein LINPERPRIM_LOCUS25784, partial [Linum perenne]
MIFMGAPNGIVNPQEGADFSNGATRFGQEMVPTQIQ